MEGEVDPFDFSLAESLGRTVAELRASIGNREYLAWRAFTVWRNAMQELEAEEMKRGAKR